MNESVNKPGPLLIDVAGTALDGEDRELLGHPAVGGAIIFTRNYEHPAQLRALTDAMRACRPGLLVVADHEGGRVQRFRVGMTPIPAMRQLGRLWQHDADVARRRTADLGWLMASELAAVGVNMPLAPVVDLDYGQSSVIGDRALAADPQIVTDLACALMQGLRQGGSVATAKHFPGHGHVTSDSHVELPVDDRDLHALQADMAPYRELVAHDPASVMMAHVRYPQVDDLPASLSPRWIEDILRQQLGFDGSVFCDDLSMGGAAEMGDHAERAGLALTAGCDWLPACNDRNAVRDLVDAPELRADRGLSRRQQLLQRCQSVADTPDLERLHARRRWQAIVEWLDAFTAQAV